MIVNVFKKQTIGILCSSLLFTLGVTPAFAGTVMTSEPRTVKEVSVLYGYYVVKLNGAKLITQSTCTNQFRFNRSESTNANYDAQLSVALSAFHSAGSIRIFYNDALDYSQTCNVTGLGVNTSE
ncbi:MAG: hypothetical protein AAF224_01335 [Pseudomonadota bacterium]